MLSLQFSHFFAKGFNAFKNDGEFKEKVADLFYNTADAISLKYEKLGNSFNVDATDDLLSIKSNDSEFLLNRQTPNRQIWLSSPVSGSLKFEYNNENDKWTDIKDPKNEISACLSNEIDKVLSLK